MEGYYLFFDDSGGRSFIDILTLDQIWLKNPNYVISPEKKVFGSILFILSYDMSLRTKLYRYKDFLKDKVLVMKFLEEKKKRVEEIRRKNMEKVIIFSFDELNRFGKDYLFQIKTKNKILELELVERGAIDINKFYISKEFPVCFEHLKDYDIFIKELINLYPPEAEIIKKKQEREKYFFQMYSIEK